MIECLFEYHLARSLCAYPEFYVGAPCLLTHTSIGRPWRARDIILGGGTARPTYALARKIHEVDIRTVSAAPSLSVHRLLDNLPCHRVPMLSLFH